MRRKNYEIHIGDNRFNAIQFGSGTQHLVILPGLSDGMATVRGKVYPGSVLYRKYAEQYTVTIISRKDNLSLQETTKSMARDQALAMQALGITKAHIMGISMGGMIAQHLAADFPSMVDKLILVSTCPACDNLLRDNAGRWIGFAHMGAFLGLIIDISEKSHTEKKLKAVRRLYPYLGSAARKTDIDRFCASVQACMAHDATDSLDRITAPTLVLAGEKDRTIDPEGAHLLHRSLSGSQLKIYEGQSHAVYLDEPDFYKDVLAFLEESL